MELYEYEMATMRPPERSIEASLDHAIILQHIVSAQFMAQLGNMHQVLFNLKQCLDRFTKNLFEEENWRSKRKLEIHPFSTNTVM